MYPSDQSDKSDKSDQSEKSRLDKIEMVQTSVADIIACTVATYREDWKLRK